MAPSPTPVNRAIADLQAGPLLALSGAVDRERILQSEIAGALRRLKVEVRREADVRVELLEALRRNLAERDNSRAARMVETVRTNGLRVAAEAEPGDPTVNVHLASLARMVEAIAELSPAPPPPALPAPVAIIAAQDATLPAHVVEHELARASREAQGRVHAVLESEPDPDRQWQRVINMIDEDQDGPRRDFEVDLSDNSFLYSR